MVLFYDFIDIGLLIPVWHQPQPAAPQNCVQAALVNVLQAVCMFTCVIGNLVVDFFSSPAFKVN